MPSPPTESQPASASASTEEAFRRAFAGGASASARLDLEGVLLEASPELSDLLGHPPPELVGRELRSLLRPVEVPRAEALIGGLVAGDIPRFVEEIRFIHRSGHMVTLLCSCGLLRDDDGRPHAIAAQLQDLTELRRAELELSRLAAIVESSADAILSLDERGRITSWNAGAEELFGWRAEEILGRPMSVLVPPDRLGEHHRHHERTQLEGRVQRLEVTRMRKDGSAVDVLLTLSPIRDAAGQVVGISSIARDITDVKRREADLERALRRLRAMTEIALSLGGETEIDRVLDLIARRGRSLVEARTLLVLLEEEDALVVAASAGEHEGRLDGARIRLHGTVAGEVVRSGRPLRLSEGGFALAQGDTRITPAAVLLVPLTFRGRAHGALAACERTARGPVFSEEDERLLRSYAATAATAVATARSVQEGRLRHSIEASEQERHRWARELHDETLQGLAALRVSLSWALQHGSPDELAGAVEGAVSQLSDEIESLRSLILTLRPAALDDLGLTAALEGLAERHPSGRLQVEARIELGELGEAGSGRLDLEIARTVYRIVQEGLTNAEKHSGAAHATVTVVERDGLIEIEVADNGGGFEVRASSQGFGLIGMLERATLAGGKLEVQSTPGAGTTVRSTVPAAPPEPRGHGGRTLVDPLGPEI